MEGSFAYQQHELGLRNKKNENLVFSKTISAAPAACASSRHDNNENYNNVTINPAEDGSFAYQQHEVRLKDDDNHYTTKTSERRTTGNAGSGGGAPVDLDVTLPSGSDDTTENSTGVLNVTPPDDGSFVGEKADPADRTALSSSPATASSNSYENGHDYRVDSHQILTDQECNNIRRSPPPLSQVQRMLSRQTRHEQQDIRIEETPIELVVQQPTPPRIQRVLLRAPFDLTDSTFAESNHASFRQQQQQPSSTSKRRPLDSSDTTASARKILPSAPSSMSPVDLDDTIASSKNLSSMENSIVTNNSILAGVNRTGAMMEPIRPGEVDRTEDFSLNCSERSFFREQQIERDLNQVLPGRQVYSNPVDDQVLDDSLAWTEKKAFSRCNPPPSPKKEQRRSGSPWLSPSARDSRQNGGVGGNAVASVGTSKNRRDLLCSEPTTPRTPSKCRDFTKSRSQDSLWNDSENCTSLPTSPQVKPKPLNQRPPRSPLAAYPAAQGRSLYAASEEPRSRTSFGYSGPVDLDATFETSKSDELVDLDVTVDDRATSADLQKRKTLLRNGCISDSGENGDGASSAVYYSSAQFPQSNNITLLEQVDDWVDFSKSSPPSPKKKMQGHGATRSTSQGKSHVSISAPPKDTQPVSFESVQYERTASQISTWYPFEDVNFTKDEANSSDELVRPVKITVIDNRLEDISKNAAAKNNGWKGDKDNCHGVQETIDPDDSYLQQENEDAWSANYILDDTKGNEGKGDKPFVSQAAKLYQPHLRGFQKIRFKPRPPPQDHQSSSVGSAGLLTDDVFGADENQFPHKSSQSFAKLPGNDVRNKSAEDLEGTSALEVQRFKKMYTENTMKASLLKSLDANNSEEDDTITSSAADDMQKAEENYVCVMKELENCFNIPSTQSKLTAFIDELPAESSANLSDASTSRVANRNDIQQQIDISLAVAAEARQNLEVEKLEQEIKKLRVTAAALRCQMELEAQGEVDSSGVLIGPEKSNRSFDSSKTTTKYFSAHNISTDSSGNHADDECGLSGRDDSQSQTTSRESMSLEDSMMEKVREDLAQEFQEASYALSDTTPKRSNKGCKSVTSRMIHAFSRMRSSQQKDPVDPNDSACDFKVASHLREVELRVQLSIKKKMMEQIRRIRSRSSSSLRRTSKAAVSHPSYSIKSEMIVYDYRKCPQTSASLVKDVSPSSNPNGLKSIPMLTPKRVPRCFEKSAGRSKAEKEAEDLSAAEKDADELFVADFSQLEAQGRMERISETNSTEDCKKYGAIKRTDFARETISDQVSDAFPSAMDTPLAQNNPICTELEQESFARITCPPARAIARSPEHLLIPDTADFTAETEEAAERRFQLEDQMISYLLEGIGSGVDEGTQQGGSPGERSELDGSNNASLTAEAHHTCDIDPAYVATVSKTRSLSLEPKFRSRPASPVKKHVDPTLLLAEDKARASPRPASPDTNFDRIVDSIVPRAFSSDQDVKSSRDDAPGQNQSRSEESQNYNDGGDNDDEESGDQIDNPRDASREYSVGTNSILVETVGYDDEFSAMGGDVDSISTAPSLRKPKSFTKRRQANFKTSNKKPVTGNSSALSTRHKKQSASVGSSDFVGGTYTAIRNILSSGLSPWDVPTIFNLKEGSGAPIDPPTHKGYTTHVDSNRDNAIGESLSVELVLSGPPSSGENRQQRTNLISPSTDPHGILAPPFMEEQPDLTAHTPPNHSRVSASPRSASSKPPRSPRPSPAGVTELDSCCQPDSTIVLESSVDDPMSTTEEECSFGPRNLSHEQDFYLLSDTQSSSPLKEPFELKRNDAPNRVCRNVPSEELVMDHQHMTHLVSSTGQVEL